MRGRILATGSPAEIKARSGAATLEEGFIALLPERAAGRPQEARHPAAAVPATHGGGDRRARMLTRSFGDFTAVDHVSFRIERGEIFGFLGSNGCGKTTTIKMLTGLLPASEGQAWLFGAPIDATDLDLRKRVGYMSQSFSLYAELTVRQNLALHARLFHCRRLGPSARIDALIQRFRPDGAMSIARPRRCPSGIRQRLSLAVAVVHEPELLILDEPTSGVDPLARDIFWELLIDLCPQQGVTIFVSTHFMNEAARCDRISLMDAGRVLATGTPAELVAARGAQTSRKPSSAISRRPWERRTASAGPTQAGQAIASRAAPSRATSASAGCSPIPSGRPWNCGAIPSASASRCSGRPS